MKLRRGVLASITLALAATGALTACSSDEPADEPSTGGSAEESNAPGSGEPVQVGFLLPENQTVRFEQFDKPVFEEELAARCDTCEVLYANAQFDPAKQQSQIESMVAQGVDILVVMAVDAQAIESAIVDAASRDIPVVAYERFIDGPVDYAVTRDFYTMGQQNGEALLAAITENGDEGGTIVALNGDPAWSDLPSMRAGWFDILDGKVEIGREFDTPGWDPSTAQSEMEQAITVLGAGNVVGVMAMNDGMAGGAIAALKAAGVNPLPPVTGMDAELAAVQRIILGEQIASVFNDPISMATTVAEIVAKIVNGEEITPDSTRENAAGEEVPIIDVPLTPAVTIDNIQTELIDRGVFTVEEICTADVEAACRDAGLL